MLHDEQKESKPLNMQLNALSRCKKPSPNLLFLFLFWDSSQLVYLHSFSWKLWKIEIGQLKQKNAKYENDLGELEAICTLFNNMRVCILLPFFL